MAGDDVDKITLMIEECGGMPRQCRISLLCATQELAYYLRALGFSHCRLLAAHIFL